MIYLGDTPLTASDENLPEEENSALTQQALADSLIKQSLPYASSTLNTASEALKTIAQQTATLEERISEGANASDEVKRAVSEGLKEARSIESKDDLIRYGKILLGLWIVKKVFFD